MIIAGCDVESSVTEGRFCQAPGNTGILRPEEAETHPSVLLDVAGSLIPVGPMPLPDVLTIAVIAADITLSAAER
jgi:hypothetical protein